MISATSVELEASSMALIIPSHMLLLVQFIFCRYFIIYSRSLALRGTPYCIFYSYSPTSSSEEPAPSYYSSLIILASELDNSFSSLCIFSCTTLPGLSLCQSFGFLGGTMTGPPE